VLVLAMKTAGVTLVYGFLVVGCSSPSDDEETPQPRMGCDVVADRAGEYWAEYEATSGDCGETRSGNIRLDGTVETALGCVELAPPAVSNQGCTLEVRVLCNTAGFETETLTVTTQQDETGDLITGSETITVRDVLGPVCSGSYRLTATKY